MSAYRSYSVKPPSLELTKRRSKSKLSSVMFTLSIAIFFTPAITAALMVVITYQ